MREGMQIESADITVEDKIRLIDALSGTGLQHLVIGSFASPRYTPQMADIEKVLAGFSPRAGVHYYALSINAKGAERMAPFMPPLEVMVGGWRTTCHLDDTFVRRNFNRTRQQEIDAWPATVERAVASGARSATIGLGAPWGSNFEGPYSPEERMTMLRRQHALWDEVGIPVRGLTFYDPMSWCMPHLVEDDLAAVVRTWPEIVDFHLHLHDARGMALPSVYAALRALDGRHTVTFETTVGGVGGCPYCGNGRATGMAPTEDVVCMLEDMGIPTGVDIDRLIEVTWMLEEVLGRPTVGRVSKAGPRPRGDRRYDPDLPFIETFEQALHFAKGPSAHAGALRPWKTPIPRPSR